MEIKSGIVGILNSSKEVIGTGFLVENQLILTCAHVVAMANTTSDDLIMVRFAVDGSEIQACVEQQYSSPIEEQDVAVLRVPVLPEGTTSLPLAPAAGSLGHDFHTFGYATVTDVQGIGARGKIVDLVDNKRLVQLESTQPDHGMSGAPVFDEQRRIVIGMITKGKNHPGQDKSLRNIFTTFATSVDVILEVCPELKPSEICPYHSLDAFTEEDSPFFFGRERVTTRLLDSLKREPRFLAVLGPSGSGKSSVVRAGLTPALRQGKIPGSQKWGVLTIRPATNPYEQLSSVGFTNAQDRLEDAVRTWLADRLGTTRLVLVIDQFEELLVSTPPALRQKFILDLANLLDAPLAITVVLTLRDDFYHRFLHDAAKLAGWLERGLVNIPPVLEQDELKAVILEPARAVGLTFDEGLVDIIIADACETDRSKGLARSTVLPLLEFALTQLWELRLDGRLSIEAYKNIGGTTGSLSQWADRIYYEFNANERNLAERIFCALIHLGDEKEQIPDTRRVIPIRELVADHERDRIERVIDRLIQARLLSVVREYKTGQLFIEIIHDALLSEWKLLGTWIDDFRHRTQKARERRRNAIIVGLLLGLIVMVILALVAWNQRNAAASAQKTAVAEANTRATAEAAAISQKEIALSQRLANQSKLIGMDTGSHIIQSSLIAIEALSRFSSLEASDAVREKLAVLPRSISYQKPGTVNALTSNSAKRLLAYSTGDWIGYEQNNSVLVIINYDTGEKLYEKEFNSEILCLDFSPDGNTLIVGMANGLAYIQESVTGKIINEITMGENGGVNDVAFSPDGKLVIIGGWLTSIYNVSTGKEVVRFEIPPKTFSDPQRSSVAFSSDGSLAAISAPMQGPVIVWERSTGKTMKINEFLKDHFQDLLEIDFLARNYLLVHSSSRALVTFIVYDPRNGEIVYNPGVDVSTLSVSHNGEYLAFFSLNKKEITVVKTLDWQIINKINVISKIITSLAINNDGTLLFTMDNFGVINGWSIKDSRNYLSFGCEGENLISVMSTTPNGEMVFAGTVEGNLCISSSFSGGEWFRYTYDKSRSSSKWEWIGSIDSMYLSSDGNYLLSSAFSTGATLIDINTRKVILDTDEIYAARFSNDVSTFYNSKSIWNLNTQKKILSLQEAENILTFNNGQGIKLVKGDNGTLQLLEIQSNTKILEVLGGVLGVSPNNQYLAVIYNGAAFIYSLEGKELISKFEIGNVSNDDIEKVALSQNGKWLAFGTRNGEMKVFASITGYKVVEISENLNGISYGHFVNSIAFSPDERLVLFALANGIARVSDLDRQSILAEVQHDSSVNTAAFSQDGVYIITGSQDGVAHVFEVSTFKELSRIYHNDTQYDSAIIAVSITPDNKYVVTGSLDGSVRIWTWQSKDLIEELCSRLPRNFSKEEWQLFFGDEPYKTTCSNLPPSP